LVPADGDFESRVIDADWNSIGLPALWLLLAPSDGLDIDCDGARGWVGGSTCRGDVATVEGNVEGGSTESLNLLPLAAPIDVCRPFLCKPPFPLPR
jgi:hypothetical protein